MSEATSRRLLDCAAVVYGCCFAPAVLRSSPASHLAPIKLCIWLFWYPVDLGQALCRPCVEWEPQIHIELTVEQTHAGLQVVQKAPKCITIQQGVLSLR